MSEDRMLEIILTAFMLIVFGVGVLFGWVCL